MGVHLQGEEDFEDESEDGGRGVGEAASEGAQEEEAGLARHARPQRAVHLVRASRGVPRRGLHEPLEGLLAPPLPQVTLHPPTTYTSRKSHKPHTLHQSQVTSCMSFMPQRLGCGLWGLGMAGPSASQWVAPTPCDFGWVSPGRTWKKMASTTLVTSEVRSVAEGSMARVRLMSSQGHMRLPFFDCTYLIRLTT